MGTLQNSGLKFLSWTLYADEVREGRKADAAKISQMGQPTNVCLRALVGTQRHTVGDGPEGL